MNEIIDLTDFYVEESDNGESYVCIAKDYNTILEATRFLTRIQKTVEEQANNGKYKLVSDTHMVPFGYLPLIKVKAKDYWQAYDFQGELIDEEDDEPEIVEQYVSIIAMEVTANMYYRKPDDPGTLHIKMTVTLPINEYERREKHETSITYIEN